MSFDCDLLDIKELFLSYYSKLCLYKIVQLGRKVCQMLQMLHLLINTNSKVFQASKTCPRSSYNSKFVLFVNIAQQSKWQCHCPFSKSVKEEQTKPESVLITREFFVFAIVDTGFVVYRPSILEYTTLVIFSLAHSLAIQFSLGSKSPLSRTQFNFPGRYAFSVIYHRLYLNYFSFPLRARDSGIQLYSCPVMNSNIFIPFMYRSFTRTVLISLNCPSSYGCSFTVHCFLKECVNPASFHVGHRIKGV